MTFRIHALPARPFAAYFALSADELAARDALIVTVSATPGTPCRVSLADAAVGERALLVNHDHLPAASPYRAGHAIFVREGAVQARPAPGEVPAVLQRRILSLRLFGADHLMVDADLVEGPALAAALDAALRDPRVAYAHVHYAKPGCFAAAVTRAEDPVTVLPDAALAGRA